MLRSSTSEWGKYKGRFWWLYTSGHRLDQQNEGMKKYEKATSKKNCNWRETMPAP